MHHSNRQLIPGEHVRQKPQLPQRSAVHDAWLLTKRLEDETADLLSKVLASQHGSELPLVPLMAHLIDQRQVECLAL